MAKERRQVRLLRTEMLSPVVRSLRFEAVDGEPIGQQPGQWVNLFVPTGEGELRRSYSIAARPDDACPAEMEIAVTRVDGGPVSTALHALPPGAVLDMDGPWGVFTLERSPDDRPRVFVGTGTGVTPLRAMLQAELAARPGDGPDLRLLFGCRTEEDLLYRAEFEALAAAHSRFRYVPTLSRGAGSWRGATGYVQAHLPGLLSATGPAHVFVCGLSKMVQEVRRLLKEELGYDRKQIHTERYD